MKASTSPRAWRSAGTRGSSTARARAARPPAARPLRARTPDFEQTNAIQGELGEGTGGVTEPLRRRIILPLGGPLADTDHVIGHELVHAFQFDITTGPNVRARARTAPSGCRSGSSKAWRSTVARPGRSEHRHVAARRRARTEKAAGDQGSRQPEVLPVPLGPGVLGVRRRHDGATRSSGDMLRVAARRGDTKWPFSACSA